VLLSFAEDVLAGDCSRWITTLHFKIVKKQQRKQKLLSMNIAQLTIECLEMAGLMAPGTVLRRFFEQTITRGEESSN